jgi:hypothetical protein
MKPEVISSTLKKMVKHKHLRKLLAGRIDGYIYRSIVNDRSDDLRGVQVKRYEFLSAMLHRIRAERRVRLRGLVWQRYPLRLHPLLRG